MYPMVSPKVLVPHVYSSNVGDAAMVQCLVGAVAEIDPRAQVTVLASDPEFISSRLPGIRAEITGWPWPFPARRPGALDYAGWGLIWCSSILSALVYRLSGARMSLHGRGLSGPLMEFFDCDIVLSPGGDFLSPKYFTLSTFSEFLIAKIAGKRLAICA